MWNSQVPHSRWSPFYQIFGTITKAAFGECIEEHALKSHDNTEHGRLEQIKLDNRALIWDNVWVKPQLRGYSSIWDFEILFSSVKGCELCEFA